MKTMKGRAGVRRLWLLGALLGAGMMISVPAHAALTVYHTGNIWTNSKATTGTSMIRGGEVTGLVGGRA